MLAGVHLTMTLLTRFAGGVVDALPYDLHSTVELAVALVLIVAPWLAGGLFDGNEQVFFTVAGIVILAVWALSGRRTLGSSPAV